MSDTTADVRALEERRCTATVNNDFAELESLLHDTMSFVHTNGRLDTKATYIESLRSGALRYRAIQRSDETVTVYGDTAVVSNRSQIEITSAGTDRTLRGQVTAVWWRDGSAWKLVAYQTTPLPAEAA